MLRRPGVVDRRVPIDEIESKLQSVTANRAAIVPDLFKSALASIAGPVIVMLDTLEETVLHHQAGLRLLLQLLEDIRGTYTGLKVILSGRYDLREPGRFPDFARVAVQTRSFRIPPFSPEEAGDYLRTRRKLDPRHPVAAIVRKADGNPFKLSLFADLALSRSSITAEEIENYPRFDFAYLIERVILRIPDEEGEVRWALRYGVIPRQLTLEFMREVMGPHIADAMRSERPRDRANETLPQPYAAKQPFRSEPGGAPIKTMDDVWSELQKYASGHGWVTSGEGALRFQPEVVAPMRLLLQEQGLFRLLHQNAARYFKNRAATQRADPPRWAVSMAEAVYHAFQRYGARASRYWKRCLACKQAQSAGVRRTLSEVLISPDFLDDFGNPLPYRSSPENPEPIVDAKTLALSYLEIASAAVQERLEAAPSDTAPNVWEDARHYLDRARALDPNLATGTGAARWSMIEAAIQIGSGFADKAVPILRNALEQDPDPSYRIILYFQLGDALERLREAGAFAAYRDAYAKAREIEESPIPLHGIERRLGRLLRDVGDLEEARDHHERALHRLIDRPRRSSELATALLELAEIDRLAGRWSVTVPLLESVESADIADKRAARFATASVRVRAALDQNEPLAARRLLAICESSVHDARSRAVTSELRAAVFAELCDIAAADEAFRAAQAEWRAAGSAVGGSYCLIQQARLVRKTGDNRSAQTLLDTIRRSGGDINSALRAGIDMLTVEILSMKQELSDATSLWRDLLGRPVVREVAMRHVSVRSAGLAAGLSDDPADWGALCDTLESIWPKTARLVAVQNFQRAGRIASPRQDIRVRLESAMPVLAPDDIAGLALNAVTFHRAIGATARARHELDTAIAYALRVKAAYLLYQLAVAAACLDVDFPFDAAATLWEREFQDIFTLMAVALLEMAERAAPNRAAELLQRAEHYINAAAMPTSGWTARCKALGDRLAAQEGRRADAAVYRQEVTRICEELDNRVLLEQLVTPEPQTGQPQRAPMVPALQIDLRPSAEKVEIRVTASDGRALKFSNPIPPPLILQGSGNYSADVLRMWAFEPKMLARLLADLFGFDRVGTLIENVATDLALVLPPGPWAALPVESTVDAAGLTRTRLLYRADPAALGPRAAVAWAQSALSVLGSRIIADGIFGPMTQRAIEQYQRDSGLATTGLLDATTRRHLRSTLAERRGRPGSPRVVILQRSRESERFSKESYGAVGLAVADLYAQAGVPALAIEPEPNALFAAIKDLEPEIIHIVGGFRESTDVGEIHLFLDDPGAYSEYSRQLTISPSMLASMLRTPTARPRPTVILETPAPPDRLGTGLQLFLRNIFAADLFARGVTEAVLATGLSPEVGLFGQALVTALSRGTSVGRLAHELRHLAETTGDPFAPTALWAADPEHLPL